MNHQDGTRQECCCLASRFVVTARGKGERKERKGEEERDDNKEGQENMVKVCGVVEG